MKSVIWDENKTIEQKAAIIAGRLKIPHAAPAMVRRARSVLERVRQGAPASDRLREIAINDISERE